MARGWSLSAALVAMLILQGCSSSGTSGGGMPGPGPSPTPGPADANASLFELTKSETFDNDAAGVRVDASGQTGTDAPDVKVSYNVDNNSYLLTVGTRSRLFRSIDRDDTVNTAYFRGYQVADTAGTDTLLLGKPGDRGNALRPKYVGSAFLSRTESGKLTSIDSITYGVETEDADLPRAGTGYHAISVAGYAGTKDGLGNTLAGRGSLQADFKTGDLRIKGQMHELKPGTIPLAYGDVDRASPDLLRQDVDFLGTAAISSTTNAFDGTFYYDQANPAAGPLTGRFYGPAAAEVGASFAARRDDGSFVTGILTGQQTPIVQDPKNPFSVENLSLANLAFDQVTPGFQTGRTRNALTLRPDGGGLERSTLADGVLRHDEALFADLQTDGTVTYSLLPFSEAFGALSFSAGDKVAAASNARVTVYENFTPDAGDTGRTNRLTLYNPGTGNDEIALTYAGFGSYELLSKNGAFDIIRAGWFNYGILTPAVAVPRTGMGQYAGVLYGTGFGSAAGSTYYSLTGKSELSYDFARDSFTGKLSAVGTDQIKGGTRDFGSFTISGGAVAGARNYFSGTVAGVSSSAVLGQFNGPGAQEFSGIFNMVFPDAQMTGNDITLHGAMAGKR